MDLGTFYKGKSILVTGGVGSIGSYLVRELLKYDPLRIRVFDNNETGLYDLDQSIRSDKLRLLVGDIRDKERLSVAMEGVHIVFHAAALKHVPLCEFNPYDAVKTNVIGTQNVLDAAYDQGVKKVIVISTDKAVNPSNVMGATKLLAERLTISANLFRGHKRSAFSCVRFGNVLNSRGSVIPLFTQQIQKGGPITVTHPEMRRFFMDIPSATELILKAGMLSTGNEIFILKMPAASIMDLAEVMRDLLAPQYGFKPEDIAIEIIGTRVGEKIDEELLILEETSCAYENDDMILVVPKQQLYSESYVPHEHVPEGFHLVTIDSYSSKDAQLLTREGITSILNNLNSGILYITPSALSR
ncbi:UDP-N-acetylglucosamine 4,6-dehydratase family protein [Methanocalculus sp.]|uniref:UDP-N-acetylglucosamine 4,6-dehydratase family protein n=1 Tax=Methanocalculus sp. TaxID=2004547 RepID=UPI00271D8FA2|nr:UDP-N-acetylglucosamine 4,6-dehydratase family protein [Methanocalculus sp.]MDO8840814.1 polysaccharide biosynthesis protein [Methanocalculus sp.]